MKTGYRPKRFWLLLTCPAWLLWSGAALAGAAEGTAEDAGKTAVAATSVTNVAAIPLAEVAEQAEAAFVSLQSIEGDLSADQATEAIALDLPVLTREASVRQDESSRMIASAPALETLRRLKSEWQAIREELGQWKRSLMARVSQIEEDRTRLALLEQVWKATQTSVAETKVPPEVLAQIERVMAAVKRTQEKADAQRMTVLGLQTRAVEQDGRAIHTLNAIERAREEVIHRLFVRDGTPLWGAGWRSESAQNLVAQSNQSFSRQAKSLRGYVERKGGRIVLQVGLFVAIWAGLVGAGRVLRRLGGEEASRAARVLDFPLATALVLALLAGGWIYPQAPRLFRAIAGVVAILPTTWLVGRLIDRRLFRAVNALAICYFVDQLRLVAASQPALSRGLFMSEMFGGALFAWYLAKSGRLAAVSTDTRPWKALCKGCRVALGWFVAAFILDALGYSSLGKLLGHALLQSAYLALILYAVTRIADGLILSALCVPPVAELGLVKRHQGLLRRRAQGVVEWTATVIWGVYVLEALSLRAPLFQGVTGALTAVWQVGSFKLTAGDVLLFGLTIWGSFFVSRMLRFVLEEEVYCRVTLPDGLRYSISKMVNYAILVLGFFAGITVLGFDLTRLTILVGAFGVGLGFGLQNIINNFVSGIILLFERPIKVGDVVLLAGNEGVVKHIGIRASILRVPNGSEVIVPNGSFISDTVTNWTLSDRLRRIDLSVSVACPADARRVMELLERTAIDQPRVLKEPPPQSLLSGFAGDSMTFELRIWTNQSEDWFQVRSDLGLAVRAALAASNIAVK